MVGLHSWLAPKGPGPGCTRQHASTSQSAEKGRVSAQLTVLLKGSWKLLGWKREKWGVENEENVR
jgi:hypothetical protein